jgi:hypothetical protein
MCGAHVAAALNKGNDRVLVSIATSAAGLRTLLADESLVRLNRFPVPPSGSIWSTRIASRSR